MTSVVEIACFRSVQ